MFKDLSTVVILEHFDILSDEVTDDCDEEPRYLVCKYLIKEDVATLDCTVVKRCFDKLVRK